MDVNNFELRTPKRVKEFKMINEVPDSIELRVTLDFSNQIEIRAVKKWC